MKRRPETFDEYLKERLKTPRMKQQYREALVAMEVAHRILELRERLKLTQAQLAKRMGTKQQVISRLERGDYEGFTLKTLLKVAEATRTRLVVEFRRTGA